MSMRPFGPLLQGSVIAWPRLPADVFGVDLLGGALILRVAVVQAIGHLGTVKRRVWGSRAEHDRRNSKHLDQSLGGGAQV